MFMATSMRAIRWRSMMSRWRDSRSGSSAVEFAMLTPIMMAMMFGLTGYGIYFGVANSVQQLAADAARASVAGMSDAERSDLAKARVQTAGSSYVLIDPKKATVTAAPLAADSNLFQVVVSYDASQLPIWIFRAFMPMPSKTVVRTASIQKGGY